MRLKDLSETWSDELKDPEFAAGYLQGAFRLLQLPQNAGSDRYNIAKKSQAEVKKVK